MKDPKLHQQQHEVQPVIKRQQLYQTIAAIPYGKVASYGDISDDYILAPVDVDAVMPKINHEKQEITPKQELSQ